MKRQQRKATGGRKAPSSDLQYLLGAIAVLNLPEPDNTRVIGHARAKRFDLVDALANDRIQQALQAGCVRDYTLYTSLKALYSKHEAFVSPEGDAAALRTWFKAERMCRRTNRRIALTSRGVVGSTYTTILERARRYIVRILGPFNFSELANSSRHGPGVAIGVTGVATSGAFKYASSSYTVSPSCHLLFRDLVITDKTWFNVVTQHRTALNIVDDCDQLKFVPKNWKTSRTISVGPVGNIYLQLGAGTMISNRLKRWGIDLQDQRNNQRAALEASRQRGVYGDDYVTLDLSMASDTLSRELVRYMLPQEWYRILDCMRTSVTQLPDGSRVRLQKFSAMGNGFTFPLETLIFFALSLAVMHETSHRNRVWVYGDDIIVPRGCSLLLTEVLRWCGFSVNTEKSFFHGDFYESCGSDYLGGVPVRPVYWKRPLRSDRDSYILVNAYARKLSTIPYDYRIDNLRGYFVRTCRDPILYGPRDPLTESFPDDRIESNDTSAFTLRVKAGIVYCKVYATVAVRKKCLDDFAYLQARHGLRGSMQSGDVEVKPASSPSTGGTHKVPIRLTTPGTRWISVS